MTELRTDLAVGPETVVVEFGNLVAGMTRVLNRLSSIPQFKNADLGLAEWVALSVLQQADGISNKQLAATLGVTRQRAHQLINQLAAAKLISVQVSPLDSRENVITLAANGTKQLNALNVELASLISAALGPKVNMLPKMQNQLKFLMRIVREARLSAEQKQAATEAPKINKPRQDQFRPLSHEGIAFKQEG